jgi:hypothetical protein
MSIAGLYVVRWALVAVFLALLAGCAVANDVSNIVVKDQAGNAITLAPSFSAGTLTGYSAITLGSATSLKVTATFGSGTATAKINSESPQSITTNSELSGLSISMGSNTLTIAHDGDGSYVITIIKPVVSALAVKDQAGNTISLSPAFAPGVRTGYNLMALNGATSLRLTVTFSFGSVQAKTNSNTLQSLTSNSETGQTTHFALTLGSNTALVRHSLDGDYTLTIIRPSITQLILKDQANNVISFSPTFVSGVLTGYSAKTLDVATSLKLTATFTSGTVQAKTGSNTLQSLSTGSEATETTHFALVAGTNTLNVVHSVEGTYVVSLFKPALAGLVIKDQNSNVISISPTFAAGVLTGYSKFSLNTATSLKLTATFSAGNVTAKTGSNSAVTLTNNDEITHGSSLNLSPGPNTLTVIHDTDGSYAITINRPILTAVVITDEQDRSIAISPTFEGGVLSGYSAMAVNAATSLKVTATFASGTVQARTFSPTDFSHQMVQITTSGQVQGDTSNFGLDEGTNTIALSHSVDGSYSIVVTRPVVVSLVLKDQGDNTLSISPSFVAGTLTGYNVMALSTSTSLKITASFSSGGVTAKTGSNSAQSLIPGQQSADATNYALTAGTNTLSLTHSAEGTYVITIIRPALTNFVVQDQADNDVAITPTFVAGTLTGYTAITLLTATSVRLTGTFATGTVTAKFPSGTNQAIALSTTTQKIDATNFAISTGSNPLSVIHSVDGTYNIDVVKPALTALVAKDQDDNAIAISPTLAAGVLTGYTAMTLISATSLKLTGTFGSGTVTAKTGSNTATSLTTGQELHSATNFAVVEGANTLTVAHSADGNYLLAFVKPAMSSLTIKDQSGITTFTYSPSYTPGVLTGYTVLARYTSTSLKITGLFNSGTVQVKTGSNTLQTLSNGTELGHTTHLAISEGVNTLSVVHSVDGTYTITVIKPAVTSLVVTDQLGAQYTFSPSYTPGVLTGYTITSPHTSTSVKITATFNSGTLTAKTNSNSAQAITSNTQLTETTHLALTFGSNTLTLAHSVEGSYVFTITKPPVTALVLVDDADRSIVLAPSFSGSVVAGYTAIVHHTATSLKVTVTFASGSATAKTGSNSAQALTSTQTKVDATNFAISIGSNSFSMVHTLNSVVGNYQMVLSRYIKDLAILVVKDQGGNVIAVSPTFVSGTLTGYNAMTLATCTSLKLTATFAYGTVQARTGSNTLTTLNSETELGDTSNFAINEGSNTLQVQHSTDGTYVITVIKPAITALVIKDQNGQTISTSPSFSAGILTGYTSMSLHTAESLKLTVTFNSGTVTARTATDAYLSGVNTTLTYQALTSNTEKADTVNFDLRDGPNTLTIIHSVEGSYVFSITKPALTSFVIRDQAGHLVVLTPSFVSGVLTGYTGTTHHASTALELHATFLSGTVAATLNTLQSVSLTNDAPLLDSVQFVLSSGSNTLSVVHSTDGAYSFTITKPTAALTTVVVKDQSNNPVSLSPIFAAGTLTGYTTTTAGSATSLKITATFVHGTVTAATGTNPTQSLTSETENANTTSFALVPGGNTLTLTHSIDGSYVITVIKPSIQTAAITDQNGAAITLSPSFTGGTFSYSAITLGTATSLKIRTTFPTGTVTAKLNSNNAVSLTTTIEASDGTQFALSSGSNTLTLTHSAAGTYTLTIIKPVVTGITVVDHANNVIGFQPSFSAGILTGYTAFSPDTATSVKVTVSFSSGTATARTGSNTAQSLTSGVQLVDGTNLALSSGANTLQIVSSVDGTYSIVLTKSAGDFSNLVVRDQANNSIALSPSFTSGTLTGYSGMTLPTATSLRITGTFAYGTATAKTASNTPQSLTSGAEEGDLTHLAVLDGANTLTVQHSGDGSYVATIIRPVVTALLLTDQAGIAIDIVPGFASGNLTGYTAVSHSSSTSLKITVTFSSGTVTAKTGSRSAQQCTSSVEKSDTTNFALDAGSNTLSVIHSAEGTYQVAILKPAGDLTSLILKDQNGNSMTLSPTFAAGTFAYTTTAAGTATHLKVTAVFEHGTVSSKTGQLVAQPLASNIEKEDSTNMKVETGENNLYLIHSLDGTYIILITVPITDSDCATLNFCSGHGTCDTSTNICTCIDGYGSLTDISSVPKSPKCDMRVCPVGRAWTDVPTSATKAHALAECSNQGICDRDQGKCECFEPFEGPACGRMKCPKDCSGHGRCVSMREMARMANAFPLSCNDTYYEGFEDEHTWDSDKLFGCVCDSTWPVGYGNGQRQLAEWHGRACEKKRCPAGDDPMTSWNESDCHLKSGNGKIAHNKSHAIDVHSHLHAHPESWQYGCMGEIGNECHVECSNRGLCDSGSGLCSCFKGFSGEACEKFNTLQL